MDKETEKLLEELIDEDLDANPMTREDALFEIVMMLTKSSAEQTNLLRELSSVLKDQNELVRQLDMRLTTLEVILYPYIRERGGISEC